jgi:hypothetical protein
MKEGIMLEGFQEESKQLWRDVYIAATRAGLGSRDCERHAREAVRQFETLFFKEKV